jgi:hypothetical protein
MLSELICQQRVGILMGTNCAPPLADLLIYSSEGKITFLTSHACQFRIIDQCTDADELYLWCLLSKSQWDRFVQQT